MRGPAEQDLVQEVTAGPLLGLGNAALDEEAQSENQATALQDGTVQWIEWGRLDQQITEQVLIGGHRLDEV